MIPGCRSGDADDTNLPDTPQEEHAHGRIAGTVNSASGDPIEGVEVSAQGATATTGADGTYTLLEVEPSDQIVVKFSKREYATNYKITELISWETATSNVILLGIDGSETFHSQEARYFIIDNTTIELQADSFVSKSTGDRYSGDVTIEVTHVDPSTDELFGAPRDLAAISNSGDSQLVSYGMVDVTLYGEDGEELSIDLDKPATLRIPITNGSLLDDFQMEAGDTQSTWSFDPAQGIWVEEAIGTISATADQLFFTFEATHFSWWNCDQGFVPSCAQGRVIDFLDFPVRGASVTCAGGQTTSTAVTDENGEYTCSIMVGDSVNFTGRTFVADRNWDKTVGAIFMDSEGSSAADCEPIEDIKIDVCRIAGAVNIENYDAIVDENDPAGTVADHLSAVFWEPPGDISYCSNPWQSLEVGECWSGTNDDIVANFPESAFPGIPATARSAGSWVKVSNGYASYKMEKLLEGTLPFYNWETHESQNGDIVTNRPDFKQEQTISVEADGDSSTYFGSWSVENFATVPNQVYLSADSLTVGAGNLWVDYSNGADGEVFFAAIVNEQQTLCKFEDAGSFNVPALALSHLEPGWGGASVFNLTTTLEAGPDGLPIYAQVFSGEMVSLLVE
tara:strand:+ start:448 stop:2313 length:1866 start_codon:yes stop_codon:yes gene_type:complete